MKAGWVALALVVASALLPLVCLLHRGTRPVVAVPRPAPPFGFHGDPSAAGFGEGVFTN